MWQNHFLTIALLRSHRRINVDGAPVRVVVLVAVAAVEHVSGHGGLDGVDVRALAKTARVLMHCVPKSRRRQRLRLHRSRRRRAPVQSHRRRKQRKGRRQEQKGYPCLQHCQGKPLSLDLRHHEAAQRQLRRQLRTAAAARALACFLDKGYHML